MTLDCCIHIHAAFLFQGRVSQLLRQCHHSAQIESVVRQEVLLKLKTWKLTLNHVPKH